LASENGGELLDLVEELSERHDATLPDLGTLPEDRRVIAPTGQHVPIDGVVAEVCTSTWKPPEERGS